MAVNGVRNYIQLSSIRTKQIFKSRRTYSDIHDIVYLWYLHKELHSHCLHSSIRKKTGLMNPKSNPNFGDILYIPQIDPLEECATGALLFKWDAEHLIWIAVYLLRNFPSGTLWGEHP